MLPSSRFSPITFFICHHCDPHFSFRVVQEAGSRLGGGNIMAGKFKYDVPREPAELFSSQSSMYNIHR